jgi:hypothetical protein
MKRFYIIFVIFSTLNSYSQSLNIEFLEKISLPLLGIDKEVERIERAGFILKETHPKEGSKMADMIFESKNKNIILIYYINDNCFQRDWCNTVDIYVGEDIAHNIEQEISINSNYKKTESKVTELGISKIFIDGNEDTFPYVRIEINRYVKSGVNKYIISFQRSPSMVPDISNWLFRRRYKEYE